MRDNNDNGSVVVRAPIDAKTLNELRELANKLNTNVIGVISQALAIFKMAQGRRIIFKEKDNDDEQWEITNYRDKEPLLPLKKGS